jgi:hypothetical protein
MGKPPKPKKSKVVPVFIGVIVFALLLVGGGVTTMLVTAANTRAAKAPISNGSISEAGSTVVTSHGITVTLPPRYENIPTTAEKLQKFLDKEATRHPSLRKLVQSDFAKHWAVLAAHFDDRGAITSTFQIATTRDYSNVQGLLRQVPVFIHGAGARNAHWGTTRYAGREVVEVWFSRPPDDLNLLTTYQHAYFVPTSNGAIILDLTAQTESVAATDVREIASTLQVP